MKYIYACVVTLILQIPVKAQTDRDVEYYDIVNRVMLNKELRDKESEEQFLKDIKGSPYGTKDFVTGEIYVNGELKLKNVNMRYNKFSNEIQIKVESKSYHSLVKLESYSAKILTNHYFYNPSIPNNKDDKGVYLKLLAEGKESKLFVYNYVDYTEKKIARTSYDSNKPAQFIDKKKYYIVNSNGNFKEVSSNKKALAATMNVDKKKITKYISKAKINIKKDEGMVKLYIYLTNNEKP